MTSSSSIINALDTRYHEPRAIPEPAKQAAMSRLLSFVLILLLLSTTQNVSAADVIEPRTGISFSEKTASAQLQRIGVRTKGPFKVYAVGQYGNDKFLLQMNMNVGAEKMSNALVDALQPRHTGEASEIEKFETLLLKGLPNGARKGTTLLFGTGGGRLSVAVNGKNVGAVKSKKLAKAFAGIYTDNKAVCKLVKVDGNEATGEEKKRQVYMAILIIGATSLLLFVAVRRSS